MLCSSCVQVKLLKILAKHFLIAIDDMSIAGTRIMLLLRPTAECLPCVAADRLSARESIILDGSKGRSTSVWLKSSSADFPHWSSKHSRVFLFARSVAVAVHFHF